MGLLDEAIREHLDLRRRHGADPQEVAREELDALAPAEREERRERWNMIVDAPSASKAGDEPAGWAPSEGHRESITGSGAASGHGAPHPREASLMEETAEIDMHTVLAELEDAMSGEEADDTRVRRAIRAHLPPPAAAVSSRSPFDGELDEDPSAWETPAPRVHPIERRASARVARGEPSPGAPEA